MKVVHVGNIHGDQNNGVNVALGRLVRALRSEGLDVEVWRFSRGISSVEFDYSASITAVRLPVIALPGRLGSWLQFPRPITWRFLREHCSDVAVFHLHSVHQPDHLWISLTRRPFVLTPHGGYAGLRAQRRRMKRLWFSLIERRVLGRAATIQVLSAEETKLVWSLTNVQSVNELPFPVPPARIDRKSWGERLTFLFVGRLDIHQKGLDLLLSAWAATEVAKSRSRLVIAGPDVSGSSAQLIEQAAVLGVSDSVEIMGPVDSTTRRRMLGEALWFVQPSRHEGLPLAPLEAMQEGVPVIASTGANLDTYLQGECLSAGIVVAPGVGPLTEALDMAVAASRSDWTARSDAAAKVVADHFSSERLIPHYISMYHRASGGAL